MEITIGDYDEMTRQVQVTFEHADVTFARPVNACHDVGGEYDAEATEKRVAEVARGVAAKIEMGIIINPPPPPPAEDDGEEDEAEA